MRLRHLTRILVLALLAVLILLNDYFRLKGQYGGQEAIDASWLYAKIDAWLGSSPHLRPFDAFAQGSLWSFSVGKFRISDPLAVLSAPGVLWWTVLIPVGLILLLGRVFCSWICPMRLLSEIVTGLRSLARRIGVPFFAFPLWGRLKYLVLAVGLVFTLGASVSFFYAIYPPRILSDLVRDLLVGRVQTVGIVFIGAVLLIELLFVRRLWCRCLCPGGAVYSLLGAARFVRIRRDPVKCNDCKDCDRACPHELVPSLRHLGGECDNCGLCRRPCQVDALHYALAGPGRKAEAGDE